MYAMVTDGGPHPPEKWAAVSAQQIIDDITSNAPQVGVGEAREFRQELERLLSGHHALVQHGERAALVEHGDARLLHPLELGDDLSEAVTAIVNLAKGHTFAAYFERETTQEYLRRTLGSHFATSLHIERTWHADRNPGKAAAAFRAIHHPGGVL